MGVGNNVGNYKRINAFPTSHIFWESKFQLRCDAQWSIGVIWVSAPRISELVPS